MKHILNSVEEFYKEMNDSGKLSSTPRLIDNQRAAQRVKLLKEEVDEYNAACLAGDITEVADALTDILYILAGTMLEHGLKDLAVPLFNEVQRSNMTKSCREEEVAPTIMKYEKEGISVRKESNGSGRFVIKRAADNKVLKNINYSPANLKPLIHLSMDELLALEADKYEINFDADRMNWKPINKFREDNGIERHTIAMEIPEEGGDVVSLLVRNLTVLIGKDRKPEILSTDCTLLEGYHLVEVADVNEQKKSYYKIEKYVTRPKHDNSSKDN